jgi:hypothetical protein
MRFPTLFVLLVLLAACSGARGQRPEDIPTPADIDALATAIIQTQNAPPEGFRDAIAYPQIDAHLDSLSGWRAVVQLQFDGVFDRTPRETSASARAELWYNQLASARRVSVRTSGELLGQEADAAYEAVRLGPDAFLVRGDTCLSNATEAAAVAADLNAGGLIGGVNNAEPTYRKAVVNGVEAWQYSFTAADLNLPNIRPQGEGTLAASGELWVAPTYNAVVKFYVNLDVTGALIFDRPLPVSGTVLLRYDLYDVGTAFNITQPFGC